MCRRRDGRSRCRCSRVGVGVSGVAVDRWSRRRFVGVGVGVIGGGVGVPGVGVGVPGVGVGVGVPGVGVGPQPPVTTACRFQCNRSSLRSVHRSRRSSATPDDQWSAKRCHSCHRELCPDVRVTSDGVSRIDVQQQSGEVTHARSRWFPRSCSRRWCSCAPATDPGTPAYPPFASRSSASTPFCNVQRRR